MSERTDKIYQKLEEAADRHIAAGGEIVTGIYSTRFSNKVCPIAALTGVQGAQDSYIPPLNKALGEELTSMEYNSILAGVDGYPINNYLPDFFEIGTKLRAKYVK